MVINNSSRGWVKTTAGGVYCCGAAPVTSFRWKIQAAVIRPTPQAQNRGRRRVFLGVFIPASRRRSPGSPLRTCRFPRRRRCCRSSSVPDWNDPACCSRSTVAQLLRLRSPSATREDVKKRRPLLSISAPGTGESESVSQRAASSQTQHPRPRAPAPADRNTSCSICTETAP